jgi:hypothetical protein
MVVGIAVDVGSGRGVGVEVDVDVVVGVGVFVGIRVEITVGVLVSLRVAVAAGVGSGTRIEATPIPAEVTTSTTCSPGAMIRTSNCHRPSSSASIIPTTVLSTKISTVAPGSATPARCDMPSRGRGAVLIDGLTGVTVGKNVSVTAGSTVEYAVGVSARGYPVDSGVRVTAVAAVAVGTVVAVCVCSGACM